MAGIYLHIPFCKQACHYCDFHFSTVLKRQPQMVEALKKELILRKAELNQKVKTIYFGGGTPSLLSITHLNELLTCIKNHYAVDEKAEITLEANPDDLSREKLEALSKTGINRLSIGVQSFFESDLQLMNRAHNAQEAQQAIVWAKDYFENLSLDLIYGIPKMSLQRWEENIDRALLLDIPHISSYALTVEPKTALENFIKTGKIPPVDEALAKAHFELLQSKLKAQGFINYEFSNFGKPGFFSQNNLGYWLGKPYLGIGPGAHSYGNGQRSWNLAHNIKYIRALLQDTRPFEYEELTSKDAYNEFVMTRLRTMWGIPLKEVQQRFGSLFSQYLLAQASEHLAASRLILRDEHLIIGSTAKFLTDGIAADLFWVD
ncbi:radical SAM family heme chaperone HemW [Mesonia sp. HuA40]|uniref:radical SAM family heme chaperone HemW n=1 Tax=Mesonia sp. HuA40 TaxID=2602761 RepID=UPI0011CA1E17|nr:radical SAM family heme chaperone HemW [Mesonia sp. HuA40]TXK74593.1 radical SAM family heme chaperone HemW [Mesonia sp. HuA40]